MSYPAALDLPGMHCRGDLAMAGNATPLVGRCLWGRCSLLLPAENFDLGGDGRGETGDVASAWRTLSIADSAVPSALAAGHVAISASRARGETRFL